MCFAHGGRDEHGGVMGKFRYTDTRTLDVASKAALVEH